MPTPIDSLRVGDFITVIGHKNPPADPDLQIREWTGRPAEILAISLPFLCVDYGGEVSAIDVRPWEFQRVTKKYWLAMTDAAPFSIPEAQAEPDDHPRCVKCGERLVQRLLWTEGSEWHMFCANCNSDYGRVPV